MVDPEDKAPPPEDRPPLVLDLGSLPSETELSPEVVSPLPLAASVMLERLHGDRADDPALIHGEGLERNAILHRIAIDDAIRRSCGDIQEATEDGAAGVGILTIRKFLNKVVFMRLPKCTGADYMMRDLDPEGTDSCERLEVSGIGIGQDSTSARLKSKIRQLARYPDEGPGYAMVTNFREDPVEVRFERWSK